MPFFVYGHGGIGKTFLWSTIISKLQFEGKIVLIIAMSGIGALLLPGGRTSHSRFRIPLDVTKKSTCDIKKITQLEKLILTTSLIIWDEALIANRYCFEALDRSLTDILSDKDSSNANRIFGGITVALGGDFRQILPVIPKGKKYDVMQACLSSSPLWEHVTTLKLTENMRLKKNFQCDAELDELTTFDRWLLQIGEGTGVSEDESFIEIPEDLKLSQHKNLEERIVNVVFPNLSTEIGNVDYIRERAILTAKNDTAHELNDYIIQKLQSKSKIYYSSDSTCKVAGTSNDDDILYPIEFLNTLMCSSMPNKNCN
ncbi:uncharacterized protein LOC116122622 [Pistacia vera]|uniref:uncharacterized protein LOC116122622 n=1 Tax=Pistacia vera TaxID=55513 RepID=UPI0012637AF9|nr:uncharacterized protein LOC116122622 [Pistacia vera]